MTTEKATISESRSLSAVWIIPILALVLGASMVIHNYMTEGPEITIAFKTASGLEQGKTKIKYRNVDMGLVEEVSLNDSFDGVIATVKMDRQALPLLRDDTRFWVVTARVGVGNISGLDTLLSGAYIQLAPGEGKHGQRHFEALEQPPLTPIGAPGLRLKLRSAHTSSVSTGDSVLYNGYKVGRVESMEFSPEDRQAHYVIFIDAPYHQLVNTATRFWDSSGISLSAGADGLKLRTGSLDTILLGGVAFGVPEGVPDGGKVEHNTEFELFATKEETEDNPFRFGIDYVVSFSQSIKGLNPGAPVEYRGIPIGRVERVLMKESVAKNLQDEDAARGEPIPILIYLEPGRLSLPDNHSSVEAMRTNIRAGVDRGLRASLATGNLLTGAQVISLDFYEGAEAQSVGSFLDYETIPTIETGLGQLEYKLNAILDKINDLPLDTTVDEANNAIASLNDTLESLNTVIQSQGIQELPQQLDNTLAELRNTLAGLSPGSEIYQSLNSSLLRLNRTLSNLESVTDTLAEQPNSLILPSDSRPDPLPEAKK